MVRWSSLLLLAASGVAPAQVPAMRPFLYEAPAGRTGLRYVGSAGALSASYFDHQVRLSVRGATVGLRFPGANHAARVEALGRTPGLVNFIRGRDPALWATGLHAYSGLAYRDLYPGIDMVWEPHKAALKTEFRLSPGADPSAIRMAYEGVNSIRVDLSGALIVDAGSAQIRDERPEVYAELGGARQSIGARYAITPQGSVAFIVDPYDRRATLIIDPVLSFSTLLGGSNYDSAASVAVDGAGNAYIAGWTESDDFPTVGGLPRGGGVDMFVAKFTPMNVLAYCTFIGGKGDDRATSIAVDAFGNAVVAGSSTSTDMPLMNAVQTVTHGASDVYIAKLNAYGTALTFGTYVGGSKNDSAAAVALDSSGNVYVAGATLSTDFPLVNAYQTRNRGQQNAFVFKLNPSGPALIYSTYLGGSAVDAANAIAVDSAGSAYVAGTTLSLDFPTVGAIQSTNRGQQTAFVTKFAASGTTLAYSTYLGGSGGTVLAPECASGIAVDAAGVAYVTGMTNSDDFPVVNAYQAAYAGGMDAFVTKINAAGGAILYSTFIGGTSKDWANGIAIDNAGSIYICGLTASADFPLVQPIQSSNAGIYDAFVTQLKDSGLAASTYIGGGSLDSASGIAVDLNGNILVVGQTTSNDFPVLNPLNNRNTGTYNGFLLKLAAATGGCRYTLAPNPASVPASGATFPLALTTTASCAWTAASNSVWLHVSNATGTGNGSISVSADPNAATSGRSGSISVAGQVIVVDQDANAPLLGIAITHSGIFKPGQNGSYQVTVSNAAGAASSSGTVMVSDAPDSSLTLASMAGTGWTCGPNTCARIDTLAGGTSYPPITVTVQVASNAPAQVINRVAVSGGGSAGANGADAALVSTPLGFFALTPCRLVDTRADQGKSGLFGPPALSASVQRDFPLISGGCAIPSSAQAYSLNLTVVPWGPLDFLSAWPAGEPYPSVSTLNSPTGSTIANAAIVVPGTSGAVSVVAGKATHLVIDDNGYFAPPNGQELAFYSVTPCRVVDTRSSQPKTGAFGPPSLKAYVTRDFPVADSNCGIPSSARAYSLNFTAAPQGPLGFVSVWPAGQSFPGVSTLNSPAGSVLANAAIVPAGTSGAITVVAGNPTDLIIDINGYFAAPGSPGALNFYTVSPCRVVDTRASQGKTGAFGPPALAAYATRDVPISSSGCAVPSAAKAYSLNITAVPQGRLDFLSAWPAGQPFPGVSTLNSAQGAVLANAAIVPADASGAISVIAGNPTDLIIDINGYFAP